MSRGSFEELFAKQRKSPHYWTEQARLEVMIEVARAMEERGISRAELARRLGTSKAYVTKILRGDANFTLETLARLAHALDGRFRFHVAPAGTETHWFDVPLPIHGSIVFAEYETAATAFAAPGPTEWVRSADGTYPLFVEEVSEVREISYVDTPAAA